MGELSSALVYSHLELTFSTVKNKLATKRVRVRVGGTETMAVDENCKYLYKGHNDNGVHMLLQLLQYVCRMVRI